MDINLIIGDSNFLPECIESLFDSELGKNYFSTEERVRDAIKEFLNIEYFLVAVDRNNNLMGFICYLPSGAFHAFPLLHLLVVSNKCRGKGYGTKIMDLFEERIFKQKDKMFLVVADFNPKAHKFYIKRNYVEIGVIPSLYRDGINEHLMMKSNQK